LEEPDMAYLPSQLLTCRCRFRLEEEPSVYLQQYCPLFKIGKNLKKKIVEVKCCIIKEGNEKPQSVHQLSNSVNCGSMGRDEYTCKKC
jgi:hypothetical protein